MMTTEQLNTILERLTSRNQNHKSGTRKVRAFSPVQSDTEDVHMFGPETKVDTTKYSDDDSIYLWLNATRASSFHNDESSLKRQKTCHKTTEVVGQVHGTDADGILRILLDTGASATIILKDAIRGVSGPGLKAQPTTWNTIGGQFVTKLQREVQFTLPEFSTSKVIQWICHEDSNTLRKTHSMTWSSVQIYFQN